MLGAAIIFPAIFALACATGEFSVLWSPNPIVFKGDEKLNSAYLSDVYAASLGRSVSGFTQWSGLYISDPFNLPKSAVTIVVNGETHLKLSDKVKTFKLSGSDAGESLNALTSIMNVVDIDLSQDVSQLDQFAEVFGVLDTSNIPKETSDLKPQLHSEDKLFLQQIAVINQLADVLKSNDQLPTFTVIQTSLLPIRRAHGEKSAAMHEAEQLLAEALENLASSLRARQPNVLVTAVATRGDLARSRRQATQDDKITVSTINLATNYNEDYPVIFNIILWFMIVLAFSLLAISYAIATMDPGRDSIIYRMTSTRMKKDN